MLEIRTDATLGTWREGHPLGDSGAVVLRPIPGDMAGRGPQRDWLPPAALPA